MRHLGDITKISGHEVPVVDVVIGGSPCQDLSIAGKRAGLAGERSGLYMEQIRIIKEMREADVLRGKSGVDVRPRYMVWENVPGAFSSNGGQDFAAVVEEAIRVADPEAPAVPVPEKGWPTSGVYADECGRWSVAWRVLDAQFWGVPQRRRRIALVADFGGLSAPEILFVRKSVSGNLEPGEQKRKEVAGAAGAGASYAVRIRGGCDGGGKGALVQEDKSGTLGTGNDQTIFCMETQRDCVIPSQSMTDVASTLRAGDGAPKHDSDIRGRLAISYKRTMRAGFEATPINLMVATRGKALGRGTGFGVGQPGDPANTISAAHSHGVFATAIPINDKATRWQGGGESRNHDGSGNGLGIGKEGDPSPTLTAGDRHGVAYISGVDGYNGDLTGDVASTIGVNCGMSTWRNGVMELSANENGGMARDSVMCAGFKLGNSEQARSIGYAEEQSPTLNAECGGNKPAVLCLNDQGGNVMGVSHDVSGTLRAQEHVHQPAVIAFSQNQREEVRNVGDKAVSLAAEVGMRCQTFVALDMSHACDVIRDCGEIDPSLQARMGTGGNQVPLTYQDVTGTLSPGAHAGSYNGQDAYNDMLVCGATPNTMHDVQAILYQPKSAMEENWAESETKNALRAGESKVSHAVVCEDVNHALRANAGCAYREDAETYPVQNMVVRRLTPLECERLQGYPDGWTDIGEWCDSKGKRHKDADSPRYKALGNSIAIPPWKWVCKRLCACYERDATMASLFDGIGGFPYIWEQLNGKGSCLWASEIEEFPIAVTKLRFGGEDNGGKEVLLAEAEA